MRVRGFPLLFCPFREFFASRHKYIDMFGLVAGFSRACNVRFFFVVYSVDRLLEHAGVCLVNETIKRVGYTEDN